jgi:hypothetical protein
MIFFRSPTHKNIALKRFDNLVVSEIINTLNSCTSNVTLKDDTRWNETLHFKIYFETNNKNHKNIPQLLSLLDYHHCFQFCLFHLKLI